MSSRHTAESERGSSVLLGIIDKDMLTAVRSADILDAAMSLGLQLDRQAHIADCAVEEPVSPSYAADPAKITVVLGFVFVVKEIADEARIFAEADAALLAVDLNLLAGITLGANNLFQLLPVERVCLGVVVTEST